jgi:ribosomal protein S18 acetylase RimI-like enzyme
MGEIDMHKSASYCRLLMLALFAVTQSLFDVNFCICFTFTLAPNCRETTRNRHQSPWPFCTIEILNPIRLVPLNGSHLDRLRLSTKLQLSDEVRSYGVPLPNDTSNSGSSHDSEDILGEGSMRVILEINRQKVTTLSKRESDHHHTKSVRTVKQHDRERRVGVASILRTKSRPTDHIGDKIRKASVASVRKGVTDEDIKCDVNNCERSSIVSQSVIQSAIEELLRKHSPDNFQPIWNDSNLQSAFNSFSQRIGVLGNVAETVSCGKERLKPGFVIIRPFYEDDVLVRMATPFDDVEIAHLRLSVFSEVSPDLQSQFCSRSCQAIAARRMRGASCIVATLSRINSIASSEVPSRNVVGTAECSFHEFYGTQLGLQRPSNAILYVTELAVNPGVRRQGIASKLLCAIDALARDRGIESIYLHVDVCNHGAIRLYEKNGYRKVVSDLPMYMEFTTSLNLHPGATKGRSHFLMCRNLTSEPTWLTDSCTKNSKRKLVGTLGFEIPA